MHNPNTILRRRFVAVTRPRRARAYSLTVAALCAAAALLILACVQGARAKSPQLAGARYVIETTQTSTFYVGKQGKLELVLLDQNGNRMDSPSDLETTVTVTTLDSLEEANDWLGSHQVATQRATALRCVITLARGQEAARLKLTHRRGEEDESVHLLANQPGRLHIFAESENVATGETVVVVLGNRMMKKARAAADTENAPPGALFTPASFRIVPASFQEEAVGEYKLDIQPSRKPKVQTSRGEQIASFKVELLSARSNEYVPAPQDIQVILGVKNGYADFVPDTLTIHKGEVLTRERAELRTRPGGLIEVSAAAASRVNAARVIPVSRSYEFTPGVHSTRLVINKQREIAYANGLDEIELQVVAEQDGRAVTPEEEGMDERRITVRLLGDSQGVKFEDGRGEIVIPKGQVKGAVKLFSARPVSDLRVVADSYNGLRDNINAGAEGIPVSFSFPWLQMLCAMLGGLTFPALRRQTGMDIAQGLVVGVIFFGLALFGAIISSPQSLGTISIALTKLPTENILASFILGFLGSTFLLFLFKGRGLLQTVAGAKGGGRAAAASRMPRADPQVPAKKPDDVPEVASVATVGSGDPAAHGS